MCVEQWFPHLLLGVPIEPFIYTRSRSSECQLFRKLSTKTPIHNLALTFEYKLLSNFNQLSSENI